MSSTPRSGYFINPLVTVALGLLIFRERLNRAQFTALAIALVAVVVFDRRGWRTTAVIGLGLALSFGLYGAVKKVVPTDPRVSVGIEAAVAAPFALAFIAVLEGGGPGPSPTSALDTSRCWSFRAPSPRCRCCSSPRRRSGCRS